MICCQSRDACMEIIFTPYITSGCQIPFPSHAAACKCEFGTELHGFVLASSLPEACLTWHGLEGHGERERERERGRGRVRVVYHNLLKSLHVKLVIKLWLG
jgi:hypothetical protein